MNSPPVDIVYTWVNGSDPRQMQGSCASFHTLISLVGDSLSDAFRFSFVLLALLKIKLEKMTRENGTGTHNTEF